MAAFAWLRRWSLRHAFGPIILRMTQILHDLVYQKPRHSDLRQYSVTYGVVHHLFINSIAEIFAETGGGVGVLLEVLFLPTWKQMSYRQNSG